MYLGCWLLSGGLQDGAHTVLILGYEPVIFQDTLQFKSPVDSPTHCLKKMVFVEMQWRKRKERRPQFPLKFHDYDLK